MDFTCWLLIRTWNKQGPPRISAGKVRKVYTKYPQRAAARARISPPEMVPSPDSPPIRIVTSFTIECSPRKLSTAPYAQHAARPCYCGYFLLYEHLKKSFFWNSHLSIPSLCLCS